MEQNNYYWNLFINLKENKETTVNSIKTLEIDKNNDIKFY